MKSNKDYSHATNVENFTTFITYIESLGTRYNPSQDKQSLITCKRALPRRRP